jgi:hypothetical protein
LLQKAAVTRNERFRDSDIFRQVFERVVAAGIAANLVGGEGFAVDASLIAADTAYGAAANLDWLVNEKGIAPHVRVIDKSRRDDGTFSREAFVYDKDRDVLLVPPAKS